MVGCPNQFVLVQEERLHWGSMASKKGSIYLGCALIASSRSSLLFVAALKNHSDAIYVSP
jgi:hypothetical protein